MFDAEVDMYGNWNRDKSIDKPEGTFPITALARTCGVSRATILRMENEGLLEPAYIDPANSYRTSNAAVRKRQNALATYSASVYVASFFATRDLTA